MLNEGFQLMALGMGFVFVFLVSLIFATTAMSKVVNRWFPERSSTTPNRPSPAAASSPSLPNTEDAKIMAAITAAIHKHRSKR